MFIDARTVEQSAVVETGVCIIGAGAAGITLAMSLRSAGFPVAVLESGDFELDEATQDLDAGDLAGVTNYPPDISRLRFFGGTTNHWAGWCRPLDEADFLPRAGVPLSGWPIRRADLRPYYDQAQKVCELGPPDYDADAWIQAVGGPGPKFDPRRLKAALFQVSPPTRFGETYREALRQADSVTVYLNANAAELQANGTASSVEQVNVRCLNGRAFAVRARCVVLAAGGLENARVLLLSNKVQPAGLGNTNDVVGRYFMDHPWFTYAGIARFERPDPKLPLFFGQTTVRETSVFTTLAAGDEAPDSADSGGGFRIVLDKAFRIVEGVDSLKTLGSALSHFSLPADLWHHLGSVLRDRDAVADSLYKNTFGRRSSPFTPKIPTSGPVVGASMDINIEQAPNPESRVTLTRKRDALGQNRLLLDWRLGETERNTYRRACAFVAQEFGRLGIGRVATTPLQAKAWPPNMVGSRHHMGTTRMSDNPKTGVVDAQCQVHGISNLFIAGSSVFPTSGYANPTLTIVALALRLGDELRRRMA